MAQHRIGPSLRATAGLTVLLVVASCSAGPSPAPGPSGASPVITASTPSVSATPPPSAAAVPPPAPSPSGWVRVAVPTPEASPPVALVLPTLGIDARVVPVETDPDGVLDVPPEPWVVGWWSDGATPGAGTGTVVLDAHLDSHQHGTGPFARVTDLIAGDPATIASDAGVAHEYAVSEVLTYRRTALPVEDLFRQTGPERVVLVTCGGTYRPDAGGWDSNVIVVLEPS